MRHQTRFPGLRVLTVLLAVTAFAEAAAQEPAAILLNPGPVNAGTAGSSWWLANQSVVITWDVARGLRLSSVFDRLGGRSGTKPGDAFTVALPDGTAVKSTDCRLLGTVVATIVGAGTGEGGPAAQGRRLSATLACPDDSRRVAWQGELFPGADVARQSATLVRGSGTLSVEDAGFPAGPAKPLPAARPVAVLAGPYLQEPGATSMTIMWVTDGPAAAWVEYGEDATVRTRVLPVEDGLVAAGGTIHRVRVTGLRPDTPYHYNIVTRPIAGYGPYKVDYGDIQRGEPQTFRTLAAGPKPFSFVVLNDLHENVEMLRAHVGRAKAEGPFDIVFFNGDSLSHLESETQIIEKNLAPAAQSFAARVPFVLVRGNHETRGRYARELMPHLATPSGRFYFAFSHGGVRFIVLDTGEDKEDGHWAYSGLTDFAAYRQEQAEWLKQEVQTPEFRNARFRVLVAHMPFFGNDRTRVSGAGPASCRQIFGPILNGAGIDVHIAGHTHRADWVEPTAGANTFPIVVGGGSAAGTNTLTRVEAAPAGLLITQTTDDGKVVLRKEIRGRR